MSTTTKTVAGLTISVTDRKTNVLAEIQDETGKTLVMCCRDTMAEAAMDIGIEAGIRLVQRRIEKMKNVAMPNPGHVVNWKDNHGGTHSGMVMSVCESSESVLVSPHNTPPGDAEWVDLAMLF